MLSFEQIKELIELVTRHGLDGVEIERAGFRLKIDGGRRADSPAAASSPPADAVAPIPKMSSPTSPASVVPEMAAEEAAVEAGLPENAHVVKCPIVGTFYSASSPDAEAYVKIGDRVERGQVLCIVEAMKLMNEIESDVAGVMLEIFPANGQAVEFGEPLFTIQPT